MSIGTSTLNQRCRTKAVLRRSVSIYEVDTRVFGRVKQKRPFILRKQIEQVANNSLRGSRAGQLKHRRSEHAAAYGLNETVSSGITLSVDGNDALRKFERAAVQLGLSEPDVSIDEDGTAELFFKENDRTLLAVVRPEGVIDVYGDFGGETWRFKLDRSMPRSKALTEERAFWLLDSLNGKAQTR